MTCSSTPTLSRLAARALLALTLMSGCTHADQETPNRSPAAKGKPKPATIQDVRPVGYSDPFFGMELEFSAPRIDSNRAWYGEAQNLRASPESIKAKERWAAAIAKLCAERGDCRVVPVQDRRGYQWDPDRDGTIYELGDFEDVDNDYGLRDYSAEQLANNYRVVYDDGWYWEITMDPGTLEVTSKPATLSELERRLPRIRTDIYETASKLGLKPMIDSSNHFHMGTLSAFGNDVTDLRNFLVDLMNHQELAILFGANDLDNAVHLSALPHAQFQKLVQVIDDVDTGRIRTMEGFAKAIQEGPYGVSFDMSWMSEYDKPQKYHAFNITTWTQRNPGRRTLEYRAVQAFKDPEDYIRLLRLADARARFIRGRPDRVVLRQFNARAKSIDLVSHFRQYVTESGLDWSEYRKLLPKKYQRIRPRAMPPTLFDRDDLTGAARKCHERLLRGILPPIGTPRAFKADT